MVARDGEPLSVGNQEGIGASHTSQIVNTREGRAVGQVSPDCCGSSDVIS